MFVTVAALVAAACGGATPSPEVEVPRVEAPPTSGLVWVRDAAGTDRTWWVNLDGSPLSSLPIDGPLWADGQALWQPTFERAEAPAGA